MTWIKVSDKLPEQGLKILYWHKGDCWVAWRFGKYWFNTVFGDSKLATYAPPEMWKYIEFPPGFDGKMRVSVNKTVYDMDQLELCEPRVYKKIVKGLKDYTDSRKEKLNPR